MKMSKHLFTNLMVDMSVEKKYYCVYKYPHLRPRLRSRR